jgi:hypothetical protein
MIGEHFAVVDVVRDLPNVMIVPIEIEAARQDSGALTSQKSGILDEGIKTGNGSGRAVVRTIEVVVIQLVLGRGSTETAGVGAAMIDNEVQTSAVPSDDGEEVRPFHTLVIAVVGKTSYRDPR